MNPAQRTLFDQLEQLVATTDTFYRQEFVLDQCRYWIYNYRLVSYTEFLKPGAIECRGIMFEVDHTDAPVRLAAFPFPKFFNLLENPITTGLDLAQVDTVEAKADGSLISTFIHCGNLQLKSKGSLFSQQALDARRWLKTQPMFERSLYTATDCGWTVNLEWCAPTNRIVVGYDAPHLKVLNARNVATGEFQHRSVLELEFGLHMISRVEMKGMDVSAFVQSIPTMQDDIEGYVCRIGDLWFKVKTLKYMSLHHAKDSINNPRRLFEAILDEGGDDLRSMFAHDSVALTVIDEMQTRVTAMYYQLVRLVESYYETNKSLDRKSYAIGAQSLEIHGLRLLSLAMNMYLNKPADYKDFMKSKYKELGFKDTTTESACD